MSIIFVSPEYQSDLKSNLGQNGTMKDDDQINLGEILNGLRDITLWMIHFMNHVTVIEKLGLSFVRFYHRMCFGIFMTIVM